MGERWPVLDNDALIKLRRAWPKWEFWTVAIWPTGTVRWCARLHGNHQTGVLRKDGHVPSYRVRPGEHLIMNVVVTVPKHITLAALWLGISEGTWGNGPHGRPTGMNPILVHHSQPLTPGQHTFKFRWRTPQRRSPTSLYLTFAWSSPDANVSGPVAQLLPN